MLTADLVHARRRGDELHLVKLADPARALEMAGALVSAAEANVGQTREALIAAMRRLDVPAREQRLRDGLAKLVLDRCTFDVQEGLDPVELRREVFLLASARRAELGAGVRLDRDGVLAEVSAAHGLGPVDLERALFADLRGAHRLEAFEATSARALLEAWQDGQAQAVLLRAVKVVVLIQRATPEALRFFFRRLKFLGLLHAIERVEGGHRITIDGPFSLFDSVTKYGLQLALCLPALRACSRWTLRADIRWGKDRRPLVFHLDSAALAPGSVALRAADEQPEPVAQLVERFRALGSSWKVKANVELLELPGLGLVIPDLVFTRRGKTPVFLEVLGYWSRAAVWKRVELVEAGLPQRILFAVSARLRVSEEVLDPGSSAALYVYKGTMSASSVLERVERIAASP